MEVQRRAIKLYLKLSAQQIDNPPATYRDMTNTGHFGTGDSEFTVKNEAQFGEVKHFIEKAYLTVGG